MDLQGGAGDSVQMNQNKPCKFEELPMPVLKHLCSFLTWREQMRLRQLCSELKYFIDNEYGIHAYLPLRDLNLSTLFVYFINRNQPPPIFPIVKIMIMGRLAGTMEHITDAVIKRAVLNLEGKVIRSLEMNEMHPEFNPFPFQKIVRYPARLRKICLRYVDVQFLVAVLSSCRNLSEFHYDTGLQRNLPSGIMDWIVWGTTFQPVPIPLENEQLIEFVRHLPPGTFQLDRLTSLSLTLQMVDADLHSDWANVIFLLLTLSQSTLSNLHDFKFTIDPGSYRYINFQSRLQIIACVGQFLSRCPSLKEFNYDSRLHWSRWYRSNEEIEDRTLILCQEVWSRLINKYGSDLLKETLVSGILFAEVKDRMLAPIRQMMSKAGRQLENLLEGNFSLFCPFERELFQIFITSLPSIQICNIDDSVGLRITGDSYNLLFSEMPLDWSIEKLCIRRCRSSDGWRDGDDIHEANNRFISLTRMMNTMRSLKHLEIASKMPLTRFFWEELELEEHEPFYDMFPDDPDPVVSETPDITLEEVGNVSFQQLEVLRLEGVKILIESSARLIQFVNLKELFLHVVPEYRNDLFGINSEDLLRLIGRLRKLDKLSVKMIRFPKDDILKSAQMAALQGIGSLKPMRRIIRGPERPWWNPILVTMNQLKFLFDNNA